MNNFARNMLLGYLGFAGVGQWISYLNGVSFALSGAVTGTIGLGLASFYLATLRKESRY